MRVLYAIVVGLVCLNVYLMYCVARDYPEPKTTCVPLYDQTGLECCQ